MYALWGADHHQVRLYERTSIRHSKCINNRAFLKRCRDSSFQIQFAATVRGSSYVQPTPPYFVKVSLAVIDRRLSSIEEGLRTTLHPKDFQKVPNLTSSSSRHAFITTLRKQSCKFSRLQHLDTGSSLSLFSRVHSVQGISYILYSQKVITLKAALEPIYQSACLKGQYRHDQKGMESECCWF